MSPISDDELVAGAKEGSETHFNALVDRYTPVVYRIALGITGTPQEAEDVVQETFLRAFKHLDRFTPDRGAFRTWLFSIARNESLDVFSYLKRKAMRFIGNSATGDVEDSVMGDPFGDPVQDAEALLSAKQEFQRVMEALKTVPERQRTALLLKSQENLSYEEIAEIMETSVSSVESLIFRARKRLLALLGQ